MYTLDSIRPVAPAAGYICGKRNLASRLVAMIRRIDHEGYAEPFVGMGGIFLRRRSRRKVEVINDVPGDVVTFPGECSKSDVARTVEKDTADISLSSLKVVGTFPH